jgi:Asp-tRNA(Asn)/Glu-tRNA(Gln) amidotransferase A subunit family amidase/enoyl-CoA hydratase/carnithine racemase
MPEAAEANAEPVFWPLAEVVRAFRTHELSPVELTREILDRIERLDGELHSYIRTTPELALSQAEAAERLYARGEEGLPPLLGVPVSIKDLFDVADVPTTLGSLVYRNDVAARDSRPVARLREAGAVFLGKSNTAEFGQSATTENLLGPGCGNPWDPARTSGGSSGGAAASVGAGLASAALGSDGGGSIRLPAAMCGLFGLKPTMGLIENDGRFHAMTPFVCSGPLVRRVADARPLLEVWTGVRFPRRKVAEARIGWCPAPQGHPVDPGVRTATAHAVSQLEALGHQVEEITLPVDGWREAFGLLVLADEHRYRGHLLEEHADELTDFVRRSIEAAASVAEKEVAAARDMHTEIRARVEALFGDYDFVVTPTAASLAFPLGRRPSEIDGRPVDSLWGPFPFTAPFNVSGSPAASIPCGLADGLPVGLQVVGPTGGEQGLLDLCEQLEEALGFPVDEPARRWATASPGQLLAERRGDVTIVRIDRPAKRNAIGRAALERLPGLLTDAVEAGARAIVLTGGRACFSAGVDLEEVRGTGWDVAIDTLIANAVAAIRGLPVPLVAAIEGPCAGAAVELAVACDVRVAGSGSFFLLPAARLGLLYRPDGVARLTAELGRQAVARLLVLGDRIPADEALGAGIVSRVVDAGGALEAAVDLAARGAEGQPDAVRLTKELIGEAAAGHPVGADWELRRQEVLESDSRREAVARAKERLAR